MRGVEDSSWRRRKLLAVILWGGAVFALQGCGAGNPPVAPVVGTVTYASQPVISGRVLFLPKGGGKQGRGAIDSGGRFQLSTFGRNDGALVGSHHAVLIKVQLREGGDDSIIFEADHAQPLVVEADKTNEFAIELKSPAWKVLAR